MPTVLRDGPYRFAFFSSDWTEPPHVHVFRDDAYAKFWLNPVRFDSSHGLQAFEVRRIELLVARHEDEILRAWDEFFAN